MDVKKYMDTKKGIIEKALSLYMKNSNEKYEELFKAMSYSLMAGGKRLRPILLLAICEMFGEGIDEAIAYGCAIEMIHTYSLIHDDLPAMDNDDLRRGRPTCHKVFGEDMAILAGDGLLSYAFEIMAKDCVKKNQPRFLKATESIVGGAGVFGMVAGQAIDIRNIGVNLNEESLNKLNILKTGGLIKAAMKAGAYIGGANEYEANLIGTIAEKIGLAFQIEDDILDITGSIEELGKNINQDEKNDKHTYVSLFGLERSKELITSLSSEAIGLLESLNKDSKQVVEIINYLINRTC